MALGLIGLGLQYTANRVNCLSSVSGLAATALALGALGGSLALAPAALPGAIALAVGSTGVRAVAELRRHRRSWSAAAARGR